MRWCVYNKKETSSLTVNYIIFPIIVKNRMPAPDPVLKGSYIIVETSEQGEER